VLESIGDFLRLKAKDTNLWQGSARTWQEG
jgi:hypothetical protein